MDEFVAGPGGALAQVCPVCTAGMHYTDEGEWVCSNCVAAAQNPVVEEVPKRRLFRKAVEAVTRPRRR